MLVNIPFLFKCWKHFLAFSFPLQYHIARHCTFDLIYFQIQLTLKKFFPLEAFSLSVFGHVCIMDVLVMRVSRSIFVGLIVNCAEFCMWVPVGKSILVSAATKRKYLQI